MNCLILKTSRDVTAPFDNEEKKELMHTTRVTEPIPNRAEEQPS